MDKRYKFNIISFAAKSTLITGLIIISIVLISQYLDYNIVQILFPEELIMSVKDTVLSWLSPPIARINTPVDKNINTYVSDSQEINLHGKTVNLTINCNFCSAKIKNGKIKNLIVDGYSGTINIDDSVIVENIIIHGNNIVVNKPSSYISKIKIDGISSKVSNS